jgi:hypothetical protein
VTKVLEVSDILSSSMPQIQEALINITAFHQGQQKSRNKFGILNIIPYFAA